MEPSIKIATVKDIDEIIIGEINAAKSDGTLWNRRYSSIADAAAKQEKGIYPLRFVNRDIAKFVERIKISYDASQLPELYKYAINEFFPSEVRTRVLNDKKVFDGKSAIDLLSTFQFEDVKKVGELPGSLLSGFSSVPYFPTKEELVYVLRLSQFEQLKAHQ